MLPFLLAGLAISGLGAGAGWYVNDQLDNLTKPATPPNALQEAQNTIRVVTWVVIALALLLGFLWGKKKLEL